MLPQSYSSIVDEKGQQYILIFIHKDNIYTSQLAQPSNTCSSYPRPKWTTVIQPCLFWVWGLICREWDCQMAETEAGMGCRLRCVWNLVFYALAHMRWITETPPVLCPTAMTVFPSLVFFFLFFLVIPWPLTWIAKLSLVWVQETNPLFPSQGQYLALLNEQSETNA